MEVLSQSEFSDQPAAFELTRQEPRLWLLQCTVLKFYFFLLFNSPQMWKQGHYQVFSSLHMDATSIHITFFFHFITVKRSRSPDSWSTTLVLLCSGERQFLTPPWVKYCRLSQAPEYHFFSALVPALKLHSISLQDKGPCHISRSSTTFYVCVMQPLLLWVHFFFHQKKKKTAHTRHSVSYELSSESIRELHFQKKSVVIVSSNCCVTALSDGHQAGS